MFLEHGIADVGPVESGDETPASPSPSTCTMSSRVCGSAVAVSAIRGTSGKWLPQSAQLDVLRAEIMPPLGHAVGLVDGEKGDVDAGQALEKGRRHQPLGRDVEQVQLVRMQLRQHPPRLGRPERRIVEGRRHAIGPQAVHLVLHQRDQRRHHDAHPGTRCMAGI